MFRHDLYIQGPFRIAALLDAVIQITLEAFSVCGYSRCGLGIGLVFNALLGAEMKLDPETLLIGVNKAIGVGAKSMHVAIRGRNTAIAH